MTICSAAASSFKQNRAWSERARQVGKSFLLAISSKIVYILETTSK